ncbi:MAG: hypothetical protein VYD71_00320 [Bacteroidota bacterium]|nr:hypothetical protein [Bacteroidota bacterium]
MEEKQLSVLHCIFFIYHTFANFSDGKLDEQEKVAIAGFIKRWSGGDDELTTKIFNETANWAKENVQDAKQAIEYMASMVDFINNQEEFDIYKKENLLLDIRNISRIDGHFHEAEKKWHDLIAQQLNVPIRISENTQDQLQRDAHNIEKRKPMGFKMSWQK